MKKTGKFLLILEIILLCISLAFPVLGTQAPEVEQNTALITTGSSFGVDATHALIHNDDLAQNATSVFLFEYESQTLMYAWNPDVRADPASMVKIMTALVAIENCDLDDVAAVTETALATVPYDAVSADLQVDELITIEELLYCMMVGSANDAASVIAEHIGGSVDAFIQMMNDRAVELGCNDTNFTNPHGIYEEEQYSTARDLARILSIAIQNETFATIFGEIVHEVPATNKSDVRELSSGNFLMNTEQMPLYFDERATGGRTGVAGDGTRCLAATAESNGMSLVSILIGAESVYEEDGYTVRSFGGFKETSALFTAGFDGYKVSQILYPGQSLIQLPVQNGTSQVVVGPTESVSAVLPAEISLNDLTFRYEDKAYQLTAPITQGEEIADVEVWNGNTCIAKTGVYALNSVPVYAVSTADETVNKAVSGRIVTITAVVIIGCILVFVIVRFSSSLRGLFQKNRSKRYRRSRRRSR